MTSHPPAQPYPAEPPGVRREGVVSQQDVDRIVRACHSYIIGSARFWKPVVVTLGLVVGLLVLGLLVLIAAGDVGGTGIVLAVAFGVPVVALVTAIDVGTRWWQWRRVLRRLTYASAPPGSVATVTLTADEVVSAGPVAEHRLRLSAVRRAKWVDDVLVLESVEEWLYPLTAEDVGPDGWALIEPAVRPRLA